MIFPFLSNIYEVKGIIGEKAEDCTALVRWFVFSKKYPLFLTRMITTKLLQKRNYELFDMTFRTGKHSISSNLTSLYYHSNGLDFWVDNSAIILNGTVGINNYICLNSEHTIKNIRKVLNAEYQCCSTEYTIMSLSNLITPMFLQQPTSKVIKLIHEDNMQVYQVFQQYFPQHPPVRKWGSL